MKFAGKPLVRGCRLQRRLARTPARGVYTLCLLCAGLFAASAQAADASCTATVAGQGNSGTVVLPEIFSTHLPQLGSTAGWTQFAIDLSACPKGGFKAWVYFFSGQANASTGRLENIPGIGQAAGVDLELTNEQATPFKAYAGTDWGSGNSPVFGFGGGGEYRMDYGVRYYRSGVIRPGAIRTDVNYVVYFH